MEAKDIDLGVVTKSGDHRSRGRRGGVRARGGRGQRADQGRVRHGAGQGRSRPRPTGRRRSRRSRPRSSRARDRTRAQASSRRVTTRSRTSAAADCASRRSRRSSASPPRDSGDRPHRARPGRQAVEGLRPASTRSPRRSERRRRRRPSRCKSRPAAMSGSTCPALRPPATAPSTMSRAQVEERWRSEEIVEAFERQATEMVDKLKTGTPFADVAAAESVPLQTTFGLKRVATPAPRLDRGRRRCSGPRRLRAGRPKASARVGRVPGDRDPVPDFDAASAEFKRMRPDAPSLSEDMLAQYIAAPADRYRHDHQSDALRRVSRRSADQN